MAKARGLGAAPLPDGNSLTRPVRAVKGRGVTKPTNRSVRGVPALRSRHEWTPSFVNTLRRCQPHRAVAAQVKLAAARAGADLRALAAICAEIRYRTAQPDPDDGRDLDRGVSLDTTLDGAGVIRGDLSPECAAMVQAVLDALSAPAGGEDLRTRPERYHDALAEAMRRLGFCVVTSITSGLVC